jgi:hypothetical protein
MEGEVRGEKAIAEGRGQIAEVKSRNWPNNAGVFFITPAHL